MCGTTRMWENKKPEGFKSRPSGQMYETYLLTLGKFDSDKMQLSI